MLPLKQFQSWADCWWLISSSVISVCMIVGGWSHLLWLVSACYRQQCPVMCVLYWPCFQALVVLSSSYSSAQWCVCLVLALLLGPGGVCHHPTAVPSDVCVVLALLLGPGDVCHHPTAVPQGEWGPVETNVSHGHRRHHASTCGPTGEKWMSRMVTDAIMPALVDQQVRNECLAWSQTPSCQHLWTHRWETNVLHGHRCNHASTCGPTGEKWMSRMVTDAIMLALVDQQLKNMQPLMVLMQL